MIVGKVLERQARIEVRITSGRRQRTIEAAIDTGYNGWLTLPSALIRSLALPWKTATTGTLADGTEVNFEVYEGSAVWNGMPRRIQVHEAEGIPMIGMAMMEGFELNVQVRDQGKVTLSPMGS